MEKNKNTDKKIKKLDTEELEQVSGGDQPNTTKVKYCRRCKDTTTWGYLDGCFVCMKCCRGESEPIIEL